MANFVARNCWISFFSPRYWLILRSGAIQRRVVRTYRIPEVTVVRIRLTPVRSTLDTALVRCIYCIRSQVQRTASRDTCRPSFSQHELKIHHLHLYVVIVGPNKGRATVRITPLFAEDRHCNAAFTIGPIFDYNRCSPSLVIQSSKLQQFTPCARQSLDIQ